MTPLALPDDRSAHLWILPTTGPIAPDVLATVTSWLDRDERNRLSRLRSASSRDQFIATRYLVRTALSRYFDRSPASWAFAPDPHGRPRLVAPASVAAPAFNLANTAGLVACLVRAEGEVGVDVERNDRTASRTAIAERYFSVAECADLLAQPIADQSDRFLAYWTLKEAYVKAIGVGIGFGLQQFSIDLTEASAIRIAFDPPNLDDASTWRLGLMRPTADHVLGWAIRSPIGPIEITVHRVEAF